MLGQSNISVNQEPLLRPSSPENLPNSSVSINSNPLQAVQSLDEQIHQRIHQLQNQSIRNRVLQPQIEELDRLNIARGRAVALRVSAIWAILETILVFFFFICFFVLTISFATGKSTATDCHPFCFYGTPLLDLIYCFVLGYRVMTRLFFRKVDADGVVQIDFCSASGGVFWFLNLLFAGFFITVMNTQASVCGNDTCSYDQMSKHWPKGFMEANTLILAALVFLYSCAFIIHLMMWTCSVCGFDDNWAIDERENQRKEYERELENRKKALERLHSIKFNDSENSQILEKCFEECLICCEKFTEDSMVTPLSCDIKHYFHTECIKKWLTDQNTCPLCRKVAVPQTEINR